MTHPHFEAFITQALDKERDNEDGLSPDELHGVYTSWCLLNKEEPQPPETLWEALKSHRIRPADNHVGMKGPAAGDYIIASSPDLG